MNEHRITMKLNQQQLELLDRTVQQGVAANRVELIRLALREYAAQHLQDQRQAPGSQAAGRS